MDQRALTLVPVAAAELLDGAIDMRLEHDRIKRALIEMLRSESDTPYSDWCDMRTHEAIDLRARVGELEAIVQRLNRRRSA